MTTDSRLDRAYSFLSWLASSLMISQVIFGFWGLALLRLKQSHRHINQNQKILMSRQFFWSSKTHGLDQYLILALTKLKGNHSRLDTAKVSQIYIWVNEALQFLKEIKASLASPIQAELLSSCVDLVTHFIQLTKHSQSQLATPQCRDNTTQTLMQELVVRHRTGGVLIESGSFCSLSVRVRSKAEIGVDTQFIQELQRTHYQNQSREVELKKGEMLKITSHQQIKPLVLDIGSKIVNFARRVEVILSEVKLSGSLPLESGALPYLDDFNSTVKGKISRLKGRLKGLLQGLIVSQKELELKNYELMFELEKVRQQSFSNKADKVSQIQAIRKDTQDRLLRFEAIKIKNVQYNCKKLQRQLEEQRVESERKYCRLQTQRNQLLVAQIKKDKLIQDLKESNKKVQEQNYNVSRTIVELQGRLNDGNLKALLLNHEAKQLSFKNARKESKLQKLNIRRLRSIFQSQINQVEYLSHNVRMAFSNIVASILLKIGQDVESCAPGNQREGLVRIEYRNQFQSECIRPQTDSKVLPLGEVEQFIKNRKVLLSAELVDQPYLQPEEEKEQGQEQEATVQRSHHYFTSKRFTTVKHPIKKSDLREEHKGRSSVLEIRKTNRLGQVEQSHDPKQRTTRISTDVQQTFAIPQLLDLQDSSTKDQAKAQTKLCQNSQITKLALLEKNSVTTQCSVHLLNASVQANLQERVGAHKYMAAKEILAHQFGQVERTKLKHQLMKESIKLGMLGISGNKLSKSHTFFKQANKAEGKKVIQNIIHQRERKEQNTLDSFSRVISTLESASLPVNIVEWKERVAQKLCQQPNQHYKLGISTSKNSGQKDVWRWVQTFANKHQSCSSKGSICSHLMRLYTRLTKNKLQKRRRMQIPRKTFDSVQEQ